MKGKDMQENQTALLIDGKSAFRTIIQEIKKARESIEIHMFIWRDDRIGNKIALELLQAAERGVHIEIYKDKLGAIFEKAEENKQSFFHKPFSWYQFRSLFFIDIAYPARKKPFGYKQKKNNLVNQLYHHKNIHIYDKEIYKDHSKYYIFDNLSVILGGINIEDKEIYTDARGMVYHDYMVKLQGRGNVRFFKQKLASGVFCNFDSSIDLIKNYGLPKHRVYTVRKNFVNLINRTEKNLKIVMPYLGDKKILSVIAAAANRGVQIEIIIPERANVQNNLNYKCIEWLQKQTDSRISFYLSPRMTHGKVIISDNSCATLGSANLTKNAMDELGELNIYFGSSQQRMIKQLLETFDFHKNKSKLLRVGQQLHYSKILAVIEKKYS